MSNFLIQELISSDQLPVAWGGEDSWEFDATKFLSRSSGPRETEGELQGYRLSPARTLVFSPGPGARVMTAELVISNTGSEFLSVKVRTTNPALFHVTPHTACLEPERSVTIRIRTTSSTDLVAFQQFQLSLLQTEARLAPEQLGAVFSAKNSQGRRIVLRCQVEREAVDIREGAGEVSSSVTSALRERVASLEERIHNLYQILALQAVVMIAVVLYKSFSF